MDSHRETDLGFAVIDDARAERTGWSEVVFGEGKTPEQVASILAHFRDREGRGLATRIDPAKAEAVRAQLPEVQYDAVARLLWIADARRDPFAVVHPGRVTVIAAGTSDLPVAEEAARCAAWCGLDVARITDVGVAGLERLLRRVPEIRASRVVIVVAGMEGALPSVVAGLVRAPVIGVPTSVGYGAHFGGLTPLLAMVNSCAAGVAAVNVDNGFGAAQIAARIIAGGAG